MSHLQDGHWSKDRTYPPNPHPLLQLAMSQDEHFVIGTFMTGFQLWQVLDANKKDMCQCTTTGTGSISRSMLFCKGSQLESFMMLKQSFVF